MVLFLTAVIVVCVPLFPTIWRAFLTSTFLNTVIFSALLIGIVYTFRQVVILDSEVNWLATYRGKTPDSKTRDPRLLAPMAALLRERRGNMSLSAVSMRSILDSIGSRLDESREISRYLISLLVFLGLIGTFWGLLHTIDAIKDTIGGLTVTSSDYNAMFEKLKSGLTAPLAGMGTSFSSSLFGLAGSVILGFIDLQAGQAQNQFYNDLEEWLSSVTKLSTGGGPVLEGEGGSTPAYLTALLEQTAESLSELQRVYQRTEENRSAINTSLAQLAEKLGQLSDHMRAERSALQNLLERPRESEDMSRQHLASIDVQVGRLLKEAEAGREQLSRDLRSEIKLLSRTIGGMTLAEKNSAE